MYLWGSVLFGDWVQGDGLSENSEELLQRGGRRGCRHVGDIETVQSGHTVEGCWGHKERTSQLTDFSAFLRMGRWKKFGFIKFSLKNIIWMPILPVFPGHRMPHSWSLPWTPFRVCWKSATAVATDSILVEPSGDKHSLEATRIKQNANNYAYPFILQDVSGHILLSDIRRMFQGSRVWTDRFRSQLCRLISLIWRIAPFWKIFVLSLFYKSS